MMRLSGYHNEFCLCRMFSLSRTPAEEAQMKEPKRENGREGERKGEEGRERERGQSSIPI
jgi:hypothetical protein